MLFFFINLPFYSALTKQKKNFGQQNQIIADR
jgi:hypothetical protein